MLNSLKGRKIHTRNIQISTYERDTENLIVEGILKDNLLISHYHTSGEKHPPNTVHHMVVRMLIGATAFKIEDIEVEMPVFPQKDCGETSKSLNKIIGMKIAPGFTEKVKNMLVHIKIEYPLGWPVRGTGIPRQPTQAQFVDTVSLTIRSWRHLGNYGECLE